MPAKTATQKQKPKTNLHVKARKIHSCLNYHKEIKALEVKCTCVQLYIVGRVEISGQE